MNCMRWSSETFTTARPTSDVCAIQISALNIVPSDQDGPLKKRFPTKIRVLRVGFLPKYATVCRLSLWSWKAHLWSTTSSKNQPGPSGNGLQQGSSLRAPMGYLYPDQDPIVCFQNSFQLSDLGYFGWRTQWAYAPISISNFLPCTKEWILVSVPTSRQLDVWCITFDYRLVESCGWHRSKEKHDLHRTASKSDWSTADQSDYFSEVITRKVFMRRFHRIFASHRTGWQRICLLWMIKTKLTLVWCPLGEKYMLLWDFSIPPEEPWNPEKTGSKQEPNHY